MTRFLSDTLGCVLMLLMALWVWAALIIVMAIVGVFAGGVFFADAAKEAWTFKSKPKKGV